MKFKCIQRKLQADDGLGLGNENIKSNLDQSSQEEQANNNEKTFTQEDLDKIISKRLDQAQRKWEKETQTRMEEIKVSGMTPEEKEEYEKSKLDTKLTQREKELQERELKLDAIDILQNKGLPRELYEILNYSDEESVNKSIDLIEKVIKKIVEDKNTKTLKGVEVRTSYAPHGLGYPNMSDPFLEGLGIKSSK